jgi:hypothetical protein
MEFLKDYKFCITYENSFAGICDGEASTRQGRRLCTHQLGDPKVNRDFNTKGFICAQDFKTPAELALRPSAALMRMTSFYRGDGRGPALDEYKLDWTRRTSPSAPAVFLRLVSERMWNCPAS